jgi:hypothetical protein
MATVAGTDEYDLSSHLAVYPNPANDKVNLLYDRDLPEDLVINVNDITGQLVSTGLISKGTNKAAIDVSGLSRGIYFLSLSGQQSHYSCKIAVK